MYRLILPILLAFSICHSGLAEVNESGDMPDAPSPRQQSETAPPAQNTIQSGVAIALTLQKKSVIFPDLATSQRRLSGWDKCKLAANTAAAPSTVGAALLGAMIGQARGVPYGYGGGFGGYGKRFGADLARSTSYNAFGPCIIAASMHEDPRFFVLDQLSFGQTLKYAAVRLVMTRNDDGERVVNYSGLGGSLAAEVLADAYYPKGSRDVQHTAVRYGTDMATRYAGHMLRQYMPKLDKKLKLSPQAPPK
jgi:hypothetical protein